MKSKVCTSCSVEKELSEFYKQKDCKFGVSSKCKDCLRAKARDYSKSPAGRDSARKSYQRNKAAHNARTKNYYEKNKAHLSQKNREWKANNKSKVLASVTLRKRKVRQATPSWLTLEQKKDIENFYWLSKDLQAVSGQTYHVDHIVPLKGQNVCGLHVPWNLQALPSDINMSKGNKHDHLA